MALRCLAVLAAVAICQGTELKSRQLALESEWGKALEGAPKVVAYQSPIKRVVALLGQMKAELEHETKHEAEMYDKMVCWCETNDKEKTQAIKDADAKDTALSSEIESRSARVGSLGTQITAGKKEVADLTGALKTATGIRENEASAFAGEEKSLTQALTNVKNAIIVLSKHQSFVQVKAPLMMGVKAVLRDLAYKHALLTDKEAHTSLQNAFIEIESSTSVHESTQMNRELLTALNAQAGGGDDTLPLKFAERMVSQSAASLPEATAFLQVEKPPGYSSGSGPVFGMLKQLQSDFKAAMAKAKTDEQKDLAAFAELATAKKAQIEASKAKLDDLEDEAGTNSKDLSDAKEDLTATREQRSADAKFLANLKTTCQGLNAQWATRSKTRADELTAVSEAIAIISDDDNMDLMRKSVTLFQVAAKSKVDSRRAKAAALLRNGAQDMVEGADDLLSAWEGRHTITALSSASLHSTHAAKTQLSALAITVQLDSFTKVKEAMNKLVAQLKAQQKEEVEFKAKCIKDFSGNEKAVFAKTDLKGDLEATIKTLDNTMARLAKENAAANAQISETQLQIKKASQDREANNAEYQTVVADQRATQEILKKALAKLQAFYKKKAFIQIEGVRAGPGQFTDFKTNSGASPVISMIQAIIEDSVKLEAETTTGEKNAQTEYETFVKDSNALIKLNGDAVIAAKKSSADAKSKHATAKGDLLSTNGELDSLGKVESDLHTECDFVMKNFDLRQKARATEMEAIQSAMGILSGAK